MSNLKQTTPLVVRRLVEAVSQKLGRPAHCRKVNNQDRWWVFDPVFSFIQHGMKTGVTGYRAGYFLARDHNYIGFHLVHSPVLAKLFKRNLELATLIEVVSRTAKWRESHFVYFSSRRTLDPDLNGVRITADSLGTFVEQLEHFDQRYGFVDNLFPGRRAASKSGRLRVAGNDFFLRLADDFKALSNPQNVSKFVQHTWPLFLCLYPIKPIEQRRASLARSLRAQKILKICEFGSLSLPRGVNISLECRGSVQGAHIMPYSKGGSDRAENGIWLCEAHHRATEGRLSGSRTTQEIHVKFVPLE